MKNVVVVGAGHAGVEFCDALRSRDQNVRITLIDAQPGLPYQRPPLSKDALNPEIAMSLPLRTATFYKDRDITLLDSVAVTAIDREACRVSLGDGTDLAYDHLVLATGATPAKTQFSTSGALTLRTEADARRLLDSLQPKSRILLIGGGFIGMEVACVARKLGCEVTVVSSGDRVLSRAISPRMAAAILTRHRARGIRFHLGAAVTGLEVHERETRVRLSNGTCLSADVVVVGTGVKPDTTLAECAGFAVDDGVLVNGRLRTSDQRVSAIGDCARFPRLRETSRIESVHNATSQARYLAEVLSGEAHSEYAEVPWFWSVQGEDRLQIAGLPDSSDEAIVNGNLDAGPFTVLRFNAGLLSSVETLNNPGAHLVARKTLASSPPSRDALEECGFDIKAWRASV